MVDLPSFTVTGSIFDLLGNVVGTELSGNGFGSGVTGGNKVTFTSNIAKNQFVLWDGKLERVKEVVAQVAADGHLHRNGNTVRLLANDAGLSVGGIQWQVTVAGMKPFWFNAPADGGTVNLATVTPSAGVSAIGITAGPPSYPVLVDEGPPALYQWQTADGQLLGDPQELLGLGDASTNTSTAVDSEVAVFSGTSGKTLKRGSGTGLGRLVAGVLSAVSRTIDGQTFDGSANITVIAPGTHAATSKTTPANADEIPLVDSAASNVLKKVTIANLKTAVGGATAHSTFPTFTVDPYYGGTLGGSDDTTCIQNTLNACHDAGGGIVVLPPNAGGTMWKATQLIHRDGVLFKGSGWHSYALDGYTGGTKLQQLTGVNDDFIVIPGTGTVENDKFAIACGITDISLRGAAGTTAGHAINFRKTTGAGIGPQDLTTLERIYGIGFAGSVLHTTNAVPFQANNITGVGNGGYVVEVEETAGPTVALASQVVLQNISGDANMGYDDTGDSGATICLKGIQNQYSPAVSIFGVKSEYRAQAESGFGGSALGNFNAVLIDDCNCPISITGVNHLGHETTKRCGDAIRIIGDVRPNLAWQSVNVKTFPGQVDGAAPFAVHDEPLDRGTNVPHGFWGDAGIAADSIVTGNGKVVEFEARASAVNSLRLSARASTGPAFIEAVGADTDVHLGLASQGAGRLIWFQNSGGMEFLIDGNATNIGCNFLPKGTGRIQENGNTVGSWVAVPSTATSTGKQGQMAADSSWLYICTATNVWRRVAIASW